jgi:hypothetical protein
VVDWAREIYEDLHFGATRRWLAEPAARSRES